MPTPSDTADEAQADPGKAPIPPKTTAGAVLTRATEALDQMTALREEMGGFIGATNRKIDALREKVADAATANLEQVADAVHETMRPIVEAANAQMAALAQRVEALAELANASQAALPEDDSLLEIVRHLVDQRLSLNGLPPGSGAGGSVFAEPVPRVHGKVLELMRQVRELGKDGTADSSMGGYQFRSIDAAISAIGTAMRDVGLTLETSIVSRDYVSEEGQSSSGRKLLWTSCRLVIRYAFVDPTDGSKHYFEMAGEARATDDKATSKAESMALKYGLIQALMIPVRGTADGDGEAPQVVRDGPPAQPSAPASEPSPVSQAEKGRRALDALRQVHLKPAGEQVAECARIRQKIESEGLGMVEIDGATLRGHGAAVAATLRGGEPGTGF